MSSHVFVAWFVPISSTKSPGQMPAAAAGPHRAPPRPPRGPMKPAISASCARRPRDRTGSSPARTRLRRRRRRLSGRGRVTRIRPRSEPCRRSPPRGRVDGRVCRAPSNSGEVDRFGDYRRRPTRTRCRQQLYDSARKRTQGRRMILPGEQVSGKEALDRFRRARGVDRLPPALRCDDGLPPHRVRIERFRSRPTACHLAPDPAKRSNDVVGSGVTPGSAEPGARRPRPPGPARRREPRGR